ncbi:hypothetical protein DMJ13_11525 [halophilic archaeon]|nr:hypothetical protein DMJ13_11525 [halophilic archaeon]
MRRATLFVLALAVAAAGAVPAAGGHAHVHDREIEPSGGASALVASGAPTDDAAPPERWNRTYGGDGEDTFADVVRTEDGGFVLAGWTERGGDRDGWVVKVDASGDRQWTRTIGESGTDRLYGVVRTDSGFLLAGRSDRDGGARGWVLSLARDGSTRADRTLGTGAFTAIASGGSDGERYALAGWTRTDAGVGGWLVAVDARGNEDWERAYPAPDGYSSARLKAVAPAPDGGYFLGGDASRDDSDAWALRVGPDGEPAWNRTRGGPGQEAIWAATRSQNSGVVLAGETERGGALDGWVLAYAADGSLAWSQRYGGPERDWLDSAMAVDGGYLFTGGTLTGRVGSADGVVVKTADDGTIRWNRSYGSSAWDKPWPAVETRDGGYLLAGRTEGFGASGKDGWLLRLESDGQSAGTDAASDGTDGQSTTEAGGNDGGDGGGSTSTATPSAAGGITDYTGVLGAVAAGVVAVLLWRRRYRR